LGPGEKKGRILFEKGGGGGKESILRFGGDVSGREDQLPNTGGGKKKVETVASKIGERGKKLPLRPREGRGQG